MEVSIMYKDIIERNWLRIMRKQSLKPRKKKVYYDKPYIAEHTENDELIDYETFKKLCEYKLSSIMFKYSYLIRSEFDTKAKYFIDSIPCLPFEITGIESMVYDTSNGFPNEIPSFNKFELPNLDMYLKYQAENNAMEIGLNQLKKYAILDMVQY